MAGLSMTVYPALVEEAGVVKEGRFPTQAEADYQHRRALQRLLLQQLAESAANQQAQLPGEPNELPVDTTLTELQETLRAKQLLTGPQSPEVLQELMQIRERMGPPAFDAMIRGMRSQMP